MLAVAFYLNSLEPAVKTRGMEWTYFWVTQVLASDIATNAWNFINTIKLQITYSNYANNADILVGHGIKIHVGTMKSKLLLT